MGFKAKTIYKTSAWMSSIWGLATFLIQIMIWYSLLGAGARFDTSFTEMLTYLILTQFATAMLSSTSGAKIAALVRTGDITVYMLRPAKLKTMLFFDDLGKNLFQTFLVTLPVSIILGVCFGFVLPSDPLVYVLTVIMLINGLTMVFVYRYLIGLISFWFIENPFYEWHFQNIESIVSGTVLPLWLCPDWLNAVSRVLPFRYFIYEPLALFIGKNELSKAPLILSAQFIWVAVLLAVERIVSAKAMKKLVVQGG
jgi:ABC-2 type transport system permease protein